MIPSPGCPPAQALPGAVPAACGGEGGRFARWSGVLASLALVGLLLLLARLGFRVQNPNLLFALALVLAAYLGGLPAGLSSAAIAIAYTLVDWSTPGHLFTYAPATLQKLGVVVFCMPAMALLVGALQARAERRRRTIAHYLALESARSAELAEALKRRGLAEGSLPLCAWCHHVREEDGRWVSLEEHLRERHGLTVTHGICPTCSPAFFSDAAEPRREG